MNKRVLACIDNTEHCLTTMEKELRQILQNLSKYYLQKEIYPTYDIVQEKVSQISNQIDEIDRALSLLQDFKTHTERNSEE